MTIHILISSNNPPDFILPSPPFYQPASSVTFTCSISGAREPIQYTWTSTSSTSFVHLRRYATITKRHLNIEDAGVHTCSTLDSDGYILNASTTMQLIGMIHYS